MICKKIIAFIFCTLTRFNLKKAINCSFILPLAAVPQAEVPLRNLKEEIV